MNSSAIACLIVAALFIPRSSTAAASLLPDSVSHGDGDDNDAASRNRGTHTWMWLGSGVVSVLDSGAEGSGFKSQPRRCRVTVLGKLFTPILPLFTKQQIGSSPVKSDLSVAWWRNGQRVGLATPKVAGSTPGLALSGNNLGQVVHTHMRLRYRAV